MNAPNSPNGNTPQQNRPIDHLKGFVSSVLDRHEPVAEPSAEPQPESAPPKPFRGRDIATDKSEDRSIKFLMAGIGALVVVVLLILGLSHKHLSKVPRSSPDSPAPIPEAKRIPPPPAGNIVPQTSMAPTPLADSKKDKLRPQDLDGSSTSATAPLPSRGPTKPQEAKSLAQVPPFNAGQSTSEAWTPKPYNPNAPPEQEATRSEKAEDKSLAKPSMVFVANVTETRSPFPSDNTLALSLGLESGEHLVAHLKSLVTTAVSLPVVATIDHSYDKDGQVLIPAGAHAVGHIQQADRSGYMLIKFDRIELPHGGALPIDALGTNTQFGPLKGKVTGTHKGRNFLVRSLTDVGSGLALFAGNNTGGAISESDLLRTELAQNVGRAGDQEIMELNMTEHPIVTVDGGTSIFVVFEKMPGKESTTGASTPLAPPANQPH